MSIKLITGALFELGRVFFDNGEYVAQINITGNRLLVLSNYDNIYIYDIIKDRWDMR